MAIYNQGGLMGVVGYDEIYPHAWVRPKLECLLKDLSRLWAVRLALNLQNKLVGKPFFNPFYDGIKNTMIDAPRFFLGENNKKEANRVVRNYVAYLNRKNKLGQEPMLYATASETPLLLLKTVMSLREAEKQKNDPALERDMFKAFLIANDITMNRNHGENPYKTDEDLEMHMACLMMERYAYNDFTNQKSDINVQLMNQTIRCIRWFEFMEKHEALQDVYHDFKVENHILIWQEYVRTFWGIFAMANNRTGVIEFDRIKDEDGVLSEFIVDKNSWDLHDTIKLTDNEDYVAFRNKPFIRISPRKYAIIDITFVIDKLYNGLYFELNSYWKKRYPTNENEFKRLFTTQFTEEFVFANDLKEISDKHGWFSLSDNECGNISKLGSPPDFYIRDGNTIILFESKDVMIRKDVKARGTIKELLDTADKSYVGYQDGKKYKLKGVGQLVRNAKRIQEGQFTWDKFADRDSTIWMVLVVADYKQVAAGWKNYLCRKMYEECQRQGVDTNKVKPLILTDIGTITWYKENFKKYGFLYYMEKYCEETMFDRKKLYEGKGVLVNVMNQTLSFSGFMNGEKAIGTNKMYAKFLNAMRMQAGLNTSYSKTTRTVVYEDLYDDELKKTETYLKGVSKEWLIKSVVYMISVDNFNSYSMNVHGGLLVMFQDYMEETEVKRLFDRLDRTTRFYNAYPTIINHQALFRLLRIVLLLPNEVNVIDESFEAYVSLLKAVLAENSKEMSREADMIEQIRHETVWRDAKVFMQQDLLNLDLFGVNRKELEKMQQLKFFILSSCVAKIDEKVKEAFNLIITKRSLKNSNIYYLTAGMPLSVYKDDGKFGGEGLIHIDRGQFNGAERIWNDFDNFIQDKCIDIRNTRQLEQLLTEDQMLALNCFRTHPVLKLSDSEYLLISQNFYANIMFDGMYWALKSHYSKLKPNKNFFNLMAEEFMEKKVLRYTVLSMIGDKRICWYGDDVFKADAPSPDMIVRTRHNIYMFEMKDLHVPKEVADGHDISKFINYVDVNLDHHKDESDGNKGIPQLIQDMEDYFGGKFPNEKDYHKSNVKVHPILVVSDKIVSIRGFNQMMEDRMNRRLTNSKILSAHRKEIDHLLVIDIDMLIMSAVVAYHNFAYFSYMLSSYFHNVLQSGDVFMHNESFRNYWMNRWDVKMKTCDRELFTQNFKRVIKEIMH
jgi:hypothetical protein